MSSEESLIGDQRNVVLRADWNEPLLISPDEEPNKTLQDSLGILEANTQPEPVSLNELEQSVDIQVITKDELNHEEDMGVDRNQ